jgi:hypothetical protein
MGYPRACVQPFGADLLASRVVCSQKARRFSLPSRPQLSFPLIVTVFTVSDFSLCRSGEACLGEGEGGGGALVTLRSFGPLASTEFDLCWHFQEAALIECFSRGSATHLLHLDYSIAI